MSFRSLDELTPADAARVGGKAWNCARLKQHGLPVPDGLVVPADATAAEIAALAHDPWFDRSSPDQRFAVRSSGLDEDSPDRSFAGIHETRLDVGRCDVAAAVTACRASADSDRARAYRHARGLVRTARDERVEPRAFAESDIGVLIQHMVQPLASGVAFTIDPVTGADDIVLNAAAGLGVAVVDGTVDPDEVHVRKVDGAIASYRVGADSRPPRGRTLADADIRELARLLIVIERLFGGPQDVEWCRDEAQFWILQSRPITTAPPGGPAPGGDLRPSPGDLRPSTQISCRPAQTLRGGTEVNDITAQTLRRGTEVARRGTEVDNARGTEVDIHVDVEWTRANLAEVLPELTSPQALAAITDMLNAAELRYLGRLLAPYDQLGPIVKAFCGRLYFNLSQMRRVCFITHTPMAAMLRSIGHPESIGAADDGPPRWPPLGMLIPCLPDYLRVGGRHLRAMRLFRAHRAKVAAVLDHYAAMQPEPLSDERLWAEIIRWERQSPETIEIVFLFSGVLVHELRLQKICRRVGFPFERLLYSHLAAGERSVSAQQAFDLVALADTARAEPRAAAWLSASSAPVSDLRTAVAGTRFLAEFDAFLDRYGHRGLYESDWALPRYREDPSPILQALRMHIRDGHDETRAAAVARTETEADAIRGEFERAFTGVARWTTLQLARYLLTRIKRYYVCREQVRSDMVRVAAVLRQWHLVLARRFVERGWLDRVEDYFFVRFDEIAEVITARPERVEGRARGSTGSPRADASTLRAIVAARRDEAERNRRLHMPLLMRESELPEVLRQAGLEQAPASLAAGGELRGTPVSRGAVEGDVVVITDPGDFDHMRRGAILVARATDPSWTPLFTLAAGVIVEVGGVLSHASTIAREYGLPALANVKHATRRLKTGDRVVLNATEGFVRKAASPVA